ncbi:MAG TPA: hypothetical protein VHZ03_23145 [Trebonia sp.]|jgi:hypothetical protein|nr:hypothetical protein [Trebonia sp.]
MKVADEFTPSTRAFWGTTYSLGLGLFDQYLLRRLGGPPLNAVLLADHWKVSEVWERLASQDHYLARQANRLYLMRGIELRGGGAFHPKTYLFVRRDQATLVVGSGNLTRQGIDAGKEVFASFDTDTELGLSTLRAWAAWIGRLVENADDGQLTHRFAVLRDQCPWMTGPIGPTPFTVNEQKPLLDQFVQQLPGIVEELHVSAPYYDRNALALAEAVDRIQPKKLHIYFGMGTKVNGPALVAVVRAADYPVHLHRFDPSTFVHAKLLGAVCAGESLLLCGSPNLSRAALTLTYSDGAHGNCEVGLIRRGTADQVRAPFLNSGLELIDVDAADLRSLSFEDDEPEPSRPAVALRRASWLEDGRVTLVTEPPPGTGCRLAWADGEAELDGHVTAAVLAEHETLPLLAWLTDEVGEVISNRVAIDDPNALERSLANRDPSRDHPSDLQEEDAETPLGRLMSWLHQQCIFDIDDTPAARRAKSAQDNAPEEDSTDFWDQVIAEELSYDPRTANYRNLVPGAVPIGHDLFRELEIMLAMAPPGHPLPHLVSGQSTGTSESTGDHTDVTWSLETRQRVRVVNVLGRWCRAVSDPRHALLRPDAPATNYQALLRILAIAWTQHAIDEDRLIRLAGELFGAFLGDGKSPGFLGRADQDLRSTVLHQLDNVVREWAAGLAYLALRPDRPWKEIVYDWQPYLHEGLISTDTMAVGDQTIALVGHILARDVTIRDIEDVLIGRMDYLDEEKWCQNLAHALGLSRITLKMIDNKFVPLRISLRGAVDALSDPRVVEAAMQAMRFRKVAAIGIEVNGYTIVLQPGHHAWVKTGTGSNASTLSSEVLITAERLAAVERQGGALSELLGSKAEVA